MTWWMLRGRVFPFIKKSETAVPQTRPRPVQNYNPPHVLILIFCNIKQCFTGDESFMNDQKVERFNLSDGVISFPLIKDGPLYPLIKEVMEEASRHLSLQV